MSNKENALQNILNRLVDQKRIFGTTFAIRKDDFNWLGAAGNINIEQPYFIASTTKLLTTAIILQLKAEGKLNLEDSIHPFLNDTILKDLHQYKGKDYSKAISIEHLLAHTSGLPDYFQNKTAAGKSLEDELMQGNDQSWSFEEAIERSKNIKPKFAPGSKNKAHYSDTNFQILGHIIEQITDKSYADNCEERIIKPLNLSSTYLYQDAQDQRPQSLYYKNSTLDIPKAMSSFGPDGGMVSTASDMLRFTEAFFEGQWFPQVYIEGLQKWNSIFFPMKSGIGIHQFKLPWLMNPTGAIPHFIGHSGLSGALAFYSPKANLYISGTVNQVAHPDISFKTMIKLAQATLKK